MGFELFMLILLAFIGVCCIFLGVINIRIEKDNQALANRIDNISIISYLLFILLGLMLICVSGAGVIFI